jgi:hypothetical protein
MGEKGGIDGGIYNSFETRLTRVLLSIFEMT